MELSQNQALLERLFQSQDMKKSMPFLERYPWLLLGYQRGEYLCRYGEPVPMLLLLLTGRVSISLTPAHGRTHLITWCHPGTLICGDVEVAFEGATATADLKAEEGSVLCAGLPVNTYRNSLMSDLDFLRFALRRVSREMVKDSVYAANNLLFPLEDRLAAYVLETAREGVFQENLTRTAELLGVSYRQLSRVLRTFLDEGKLARTGQGWRVADRSALERQAADILPLEL